VSVKPEDQLVPKRALISSWRSREPSRRRDNSQKKSINPWSICRASPVTAPPFTLQELYAMGYPLIIEPQGGLVMAYGAMRKAYLELKEKGRLACDAAEIRMIRDEINALVDLPKYWELEARTVER
jgi:hypothetical protein